MKKQYYCLISSLFFSLLATAQTIPNAGFENWTSMGTYYEPDGWSTLNSTTAPLSIYTATQGTPGSPGNYYLKLTSKAIAGSGVTPGMAVSGGFYNGTTQPVGGFPISQRPANLTGKWQHMIFGSSQGYITIILTRWDGVQKETVSYTRYDLTGMAMNWANFSIPLNYINSNTPDSCLIILSASGNAPTANDYLWVDNLSFTGTATGIATIDKSEGITIYPNPVHDKLVLQVENKNADMTTLKILDIKGSVVQQIPGVFSGVNTALEVSGLPKGTYFLSGRKEEENFLVKFIKE